MVSYNFNETHQESGETYEDGNILEAADRTTVLRETHAISEHKGDFDDPCDPDSHQGITEDRMRLSADWVVLGVGTHGPPCHQQHKTRDEIALRTAVTVLAEPDTRQAGTPPDDAHRGVLPVVLNPVGAPSMLGEGVDAAPCGNDDAIKKFLRPAGAPEPQLPNEQHQGQNDPVRDERTTHDEMRQAPSDVVALAEP